MTRQPPADRTPMPAKRKRRIIALELDPCSNMPLEPSPLDREWMDRSNQRHAYRCLPLMIANQSGWIVRSPIAFSVRWNGGNRVDDVTVKLPRGRRDARICSHFGEGVVTLILPYLFRTPRGINLWVKGPSNWIKDGIQPLEGVVETDWSEATFTMNWKVTRKNHRIQFEQDEPISMLVPVPRGLAESLDPVLQPLDANPKLARAYQSWRAARFAFNDALSRRDAPTTERGWQRDYMLGLNTDGQPFADHQMKLNLQPFRRE